MPLTIAPGWVTVMKPQATTTSNNTALTNDPHLFFTVGPNKKVAIRGKIFFDTAATPDFKFGFNFNGSSPDPTMRIQVVAVAAGATSYSAIAVQQPTPTAVSVTGTGSSGGFVSFDGMVENASSTPFVLNFQWAQNTTSGSTTLVLYGSYIEYYVVN